jgi:hypothetical protein
MDDNQEDIDEDEGMAMENIESDEEFYCYKTLLYALFLATRISITNVPRKTCARPWQRLWRY